MAHGKKQRAHALRPNRIDHAVQWGQVQRMRLVGGLWVPTALSNCVTGATHSSQTSVAALGHDTAMRQGR